MSSCNTKTEIIQNAKSICQQKNLRFTPLRQKVLEIIADRRSSTKAYDILDIIKNEYNAKPPTVYRTLDFLLKNGMVHKIQSLNTYISCSHPLKHNDCYFLICHKCGGTTECCNSSITAAIGQTSQQRNFNHKHTTLEVLGVCQDCS